VADINLIRTRAGLSALSTSISSEDAFEALMSERRREFFFEWGHRWIDLVRTNRVEDELLKSAKFQSWPGNWYKLFPIPLKELDSNPKLTQNPGYDILVDHNL